MKRLSTNELQARLIYAAIVAGKSADFADQVCVKLWAHLKRFPGGGIESPFAMIRRLMKADVLNFTLHRCRTGNYGKLSRCLTAIACAEIDLRRVTPQELETFHGIGPKTSRFFILWTRPNARYAALDVHILRWLRQLGHDAPKSTPTGGTYLCWEKVFLAECDARGMKPRDLDYKIWQAGAGRTQESSGL